MLRKYLSLFLRLFFLFLVCDPLISTALRPDDGFNLPPLITKEQRRTFASNDFGEILAIDVDGYGGPYHLQLITMEPNSFFLPVLLQTVMVFYVDSGMFLEGGGESTSKSMKILVFKIFLIWGVWLVRKFKNHETRLQLEGNRAE